MTELLTSDEHKAMDLTAELYNLLCQSVIGAGPSRPGDVNELAQHIHGIQNMVLAQAAARAYPERYRSLGDVVLRMHHLTCTDVLPSAANRSGGGRGPRPGGGLQR